MQGRYYQAGADTTRTEQALQHARELRQRQRADLERVKSEHAESSVLVGRDQEQLGELGRFLAQAEPELNAAQEKETSARSVLSAAEASLADWQQRWEEFSRESSDAMLNSQVEQARLEQIEAGILRLRAQRERLEKERTQLENSASGARPDEFVAAEQQARDRVREAQQELDGTLASLQSLREAEREGASALDAAKAEMQAAQGELMAVEAVQKAALGRGQAGPSEWLEKHNLDSRPRLAQQLEVEKGWERAVETALGSYLEAVCVEGIDAIAESMDGLSAGQLTIAESGRPVAAKPAAGSLLLRVKGPAVATELLAWGCHGRVAGRCGRAAAIAAARAVCHHAQRYLARARVGTRRAERSRPRGSHRAREGLEAPAEGRC